MSSVTPSAQFVQMMQRAASVHEASASKLENIKGNPPEDGMFLLMYIADLKAFAERCKLLALGTMPSQDAPPIQFVTVEGKLYHEKITDDDIDAFQDALTNITVRNNRHDSLELYNLLERFLEIHRSEGNLRFAKKFTALEKERDELQYALAMKNSTDGTNRLRELVKGLREKYLASDEFIGEYTDRMLEIIDGKEPQGA